MPRPAGGTQELKNSGIEDYREGNARQGASFNSISCNARHASPLVLSQLKCHLILTIVAYKIFSLATVCLIGRLYKTRTVRHGFHSIFRLDAAEQPKSCREDDFIFSTHLLADFPDFVSWDLIDFGDATARGRQNHISPFNSIQFNFYL